MTLKNMAMATGSNYKRQGAKIALMRARRAYEIMQCFKCVSNRVNYENRDCNV